MEVMPEGIAIREAIAANDPSRLVVAVKEYAHLTRNPYNDERHTFLGPSIPISPGQAVHNGEHAESDESPQDRRPQDGLQKERLWLHLLFYNTGNDCQRQGHYDLALVCYQEAVKCKSDPSVTNNMAVVHKRMGNYAAAVECHKQNIAEFPSYIPAYGRLAIVLVAYGCSTETLPLEYLRMYFDKGGDKMQLQAFVTGLPPVERQALDTLLRQMIAEDAAKSIERRQSKKKPPKKYKSPFGRN
jgi:tetratricopeptide (TPR) repeat protein